MKSRRTIPQAMKKLRSADVPAEIFNPDNNKQVFEDTKVQGELVVADSKLVMFDGTETNPTMLINVDCRYHIEVPLTRTKIYILLDHLNNLLRTGKVK